MRDRTFENGRRGTIQSVFFGYCTSKHTWMQTENFVLFSSDAIHLFFGEGQGPTSKRTRQQLAIIGAIEGFHPTRSGRQKGQRGGGEKKFIYLRCITLSFVLAYKATLHSRSQKATLLASSLLGILFDLVDRRSVIDNFLFPSFVGPTRTFIIRDFDCFSFEFTTYTYTLQVK